MKKLLLSLAALVAATTMQAEQKSVTFDFTNPAAYGYDAPPAGDTNGTALEVGQTITSGDVVITDVANGNTPVRFYINANSGVITLRMASGCAISVEAGGATISKIEVTGNNVGASNVSVDCGTWSDQLWEGEATKVTLTRAASTVQFQTMTVTYETVETPVDPGDDTDEWTETFTAISWPTEDLNGDGEINASDLQACEAFANAVVENGASTVKFGTESIEVEAVGGTTAKDVYQEAGTDFAGWTEWNDVKWDVKNQGDIKYAYILGTGNPAVAFDAEEVLTEEQRTGHYRPVYTYYEADGSKGMPLMGLYYKFTPKYSGTLKVNVWSNKGNRFTYFVDEDTQKPVKYQAEGYVNGQNEGTGVFDDNGNEVQRKKWLSTEEIQFIHDNAKCEKDADGNIIPGTDSAPWVIGAGNQPFWGTLTISVDRGHSYWLFQHSSQIGFQSFTYRPDLVGGISDVEAKQNDAIFNLRGERVSSMNRGQMYIKNGKKIVIR